MPTTTSICRARTPTSRPIAATRRSSCPADLDFDAVPGLSNEARQKLRAARPRTIGQAARIDGMTPAALTLLAAFVRGKATKAAARPSANELPRFRIIAIVAGDASRLAADKARALTSIPVSRETEARSITSWIVFCAGRRQRTSSRRRRLSMSSGPGTSPTRCSSSRSRPTRESGSISARRAAFPDSSSPARSPVVRARWLHLVESNAEEGRLPARGDSRSPARRPWSTRSASRSSQPPAHADVVTARALAPLEKLLGYAYPLLKPARSGCSQRDKM